MSYDTVEGSHLAAKQYELGLLIRMWNDSKSGCSKIPVKTLLPPPPQKK